MKKIIIFLTLIIILNMFLNYDFVLNNVNNITYMFIKKIFPPLFIFFVLSSILINYGFIDIINNTLGIITNKLFKINKYLSYIFFMSMLSGSPGNAKYTNELINKNLITELEGEKILLFSHFTNPLFILSIAPDKPMLIIFCHYVTNFILGIIFRNFNPSNTTKLINQERKSKLSEVLANSINDAIHLLLGILGIIVVFNVISITFNNFILKYILEMTSSINFINLSLLNTKLKLILICGILSFGGICVHMQVFNILNGKKIRYKPYLLARIMHFIISTFLIYILY